MVQLTPATLRSATMAPSPYSHRVERGPEQAGGPVSADTPPPPPALARALLGSRHCLLRQTFPTTDAYEPARVSCGCVPLLPACAPCSQAHSPDADAVVEGATQDSEAELAVVQPAWCRPDRRPPIVVLADPTDHLHPRRVQGGPTRPARTHCAALPHSPGPGQQETG